MVLWAYNDKKKQENAELGQLLGLHPVILVILKVSWRHKRRRLMGRPKFGKKYFSGNYRVKFGNFVLLLFGANIKIWAV